jgi:methionyl-tRNA formyltransferase
MAKQNDASDTGNGGSGNHSALTVVVLTCGDLGVVAANAISALPSVRKVVLVIAPYRRIRRTFLGKLRRIYRTQGWRGFLGVAGAKLRALFGAADPRYPIRSNVKLAPNVERLDVPAFETPQCVAAIRASKPDLGVVVGTYVLREEVFGIPRLGSINLHTGKVPEYRGAAPVFWELYNGEGEVGITIHGVVAALDAGPVFLQETFPLDPAPAGDPLSYIDSYRRDVLEPNGVRMLARAVTGIADGTLRPVPQESQRSATYKTPDYPAVRELRSRVAARRGAAAKAGK